MFALLIVPYQGDSLLSQECLSPQRTSISAKPEAQIIPAGESLQLCALRQGSVSFNCLQSQAKVQRGVAAASSQTRELASYGQLCQLGTHMWNSTGGLPLGKFGEELPIV